MIINSGQYGEVIKVNSVAIKKMDITRASSWIIELILTRNLKSNHIMTAREITITDDTVSIIMDYAQYDLHMWRSRHRNIDYSVAKTMIADIASGLSYLHYCDLLHGDIKPSNILVIIESTPRCKISDLGYSGIQKGRSVVRYGTSMYSSPECLLGGSSKFEADIWALGLVISYIITARLPWRFDRINKLQYDKMLFVCCAYTWSLHVKQDWPYLRPINTYNVEIDNSAIFTGNLYNVMKACLSIDVSSRPSSIDIVEYLDEGEDPGIELFPEISGCRCCDCNFDAIYAEDIRSMLEGKYVNAGNRMRKIVELLASIDFMPTLYCSSGKVY